MITEIIIAIIAIVGISIIGLALMTAKSRERARQAKWRREYHDYVKRTSVRR